jgi:F420-dependent oxidoreductase-like protein
VKFGLHIIQQGISITELRELWAWADTAGFDWVDVSDHFYEAPFVDGTTGYFEGTSLLAALACETRNVRVGAVVFGAGYRHPAVLAKTLVTIDHLSGGRLEIGLGAGWHEPEYRAFGIPFEPLKQRMDRLEEALQVVRLLATEERASFDGAYYQLYDAAAFPRPVQARPRIWVGGNGERRTLGIVARHADGWNSPYTSPAEFARLCGRLDEWCEREGRDPGAIERNVNLSFHLATGEADRARAEADLQRTWGPAAKRMLRGGAVAGTPAEAVDAVAAYAEAGCARVNIAVRPPLHWDALRAWATDVIGAFA